MPKSVGKPPLFASISNGLPPPLIPFPFPLFDAAVVVVVNFDVVAVVFVDMDVVDCAWVAVSVVLVLVSVFVFVLEDVDVDSEELDVVDFDEVDDGDDDV